MKDKNTEIDFSFIHSLRDKFLAGDEEAYSAIYKLYAKDLYALGLSFRVKPELIEDAIQDVFVEIYTHKHNLEKVDNLKLYLMTAFRNRLFLLVKKSSNNFEIEEDIYELEEPGYQELWIEKEEESEKQLLVKHLLSQLNANQREAIYYRFVEGFSCEEIASIMHINYQSTKNLIHRAIKKLRSISAFTMLLLLLLC